MTRVRQAAGGGRVVEVSSDRVSGWLMRFGERHGGLTVKDMSPTAVAVIGGDGALATLEVPFAPMDLGQYEPVEALLEHMASLGDLAAIVVRERAFSVGICRSGKVLVSSTDTRYVQSRTAAGGWSQQRYARRRDNQRRDSYRAAADRANRVFAEHVGAFAGIIAAGDRTAIDTVLSDPRFKHLAALPRRSFVDVGEPRRAVLDEVAERAMTVEITIRDADATSGK
ncbi:MAG: acVLRF1 family peptidyl-tRNA hydrolase [Nakamurella sp.]